MVSSSFELISEKLVKPSFSTPPSLRNYKLSLQDQLTENDYIPLALFYPHIQNVDTSSQTSSPSFFLEDSLSKTLCCYYPFAGRLTDKISVDCNDMGVTFLEGRIRSPLSDFLGSTRQDHIIFPCGLPWNEGAHQPSLMVAQLSHFDCGGKALTVCLRHNIGDAHTLFRFMNDWSAIARQKPSPEFIGASLLPPVEDLSGAGPEWEDFSLIKCVTRRYTFDSKILSQLKAKATAESQVQNPTRVEVVSALLYKCAVSASTVCSGSFKPSVLVSMFNMRQLISTQNYVGNLFTFLPVHTTDEKEINFSNLVTEIRREKIQYSEKYKGMAATQLSADTLKTNEYIKVLYLMNNDIDKYTCSSWCGFPTHEIEFGWGSPIRVSSAPPTWNNSLLLTDIPNAGAGGDGIEAMVTLEEKVMNVFQNDPEILALSHTSTS